MSDHQVRAHAPPKSARASIPLALPRVPKYVPNSANLDPTRPTQLDWIVPNRARPASNIALVMKGSPVQVRASALARTTQPLLHSSPHGRRMQHWPISPSATVFLRRGPWGAGAVVVPTEP